MLDGMLGEMASYGRPGGGDGADASAPKPQAGPSPTAGLALLSAEAGKAAAAAVTAEPDARQKRAPKTHNPGGRRPRRVAGFGRAVSHRCGRPRGRRSWAILGKVCLGIRCHGGWPALYGT